MSARPHVCSTHICSTACTTSDAILRLGPGFPASTWGRGLRIARCCGIWYCEKMKNITVTVDEDTYRAARIKAAEADTSVSALVKQFLAEFARGVSEADQLKAHEVELRGRVDRFSAGDRLARDAVHARGSA